MKTEIFKPIKDFDGYVIGDKGTVKKMATKITRKDGKTIHYIEKVLVPQTLPKNGLKYVYLRNKNGKVSIKAIQRLVADTFKDNPDNKKFIKFIDGDKNNFNVENLEFTNNHADCRRKRKKVYCGGLVFDSADKCAEHFKISTSLMYAYLSGQKKSDRFQKMRLTYI